MALPFKLGTTEVSANIESGWLFKDWDSHDGRRFRIVKNGDSTMTSAAYRAFAVSGNAGTSYLVNRAVGTSTPAGICSVEYSGRTVTSGTYFFIQTGGKAIGYIGSGGTGVTKGDFVVADDDAALGQLGKMVAPTGSTIASTLIVMRRTFGKALSNAAANSAVYVELMLNTGAAIGG